ncbi:MAG: PACE efflux transporter [Pseudoalteromonas prydzensis]|uniref:PACE efflux transporter n=1 Tax=Pseudoalteromonas prydzensis TaxID=182141 RepID=UPI003F9B4A9A
MNTIERFFQAILFELTTLAIVIPMTVLIAGYETGKMAMVGISLSMFAMLWNYIYNLLFDKLAGYERINRGLAIRISHALGFELGMVIITLPVLAWYLNITWLAAAILEAGFLVFILIYTLVFNWLYDKYQPYKKWVSNEKHVATT